MNDKTEWWREFFRGPWGEVQARGYREEETRRQVDFLVSALRLEQGARVLDTSCGVGGHCIELARRGYEATGIDFNGSALAIAANAAADAGVTPRFVEMDIRQLQEREAYDAAFSFWTSFGYFSDEDNLDVASRFADALKPGGRLLIDTRVTECLLPIFQEFQWNWADEARTVRVLEENKWDMASGRMEATWSFVRDDSPIETARSSVRIYSYKELIELLEAAGFCEFKDFLTGTDQQFQMGSQRLSIVAEKAGG